MSFRRARYQAARPTGLLPSFRECLLRGRRTRLKRRAEWLQTTAAGIERLEDRTLLSSITTLSQLTTDPDADPGDGHEHEHHEIIARSETVTHLTNGGQFLTGPNDGKPLQIALDFLRNNADQLGLETSDFNDAVLADHYQTQHNGATHIYLRQTYGDLEVVNADVNINITAAGEVVNVGSSFVAGLGAQPEAFLADPILTAPEALEALAGEFDWVLDTTPEILSQEGGPSQKTVLDASGVSLEDIPAELHYVPATEGGVELAWKLNVQTTDLLHWYDASVSAIDGELLNLSDWMAHATYNVVPLPYGDPADSPRMVVTDPQDATASPFGWHDTDGAAGAEFTDTRGNNVFAQEDRDATDSGNGNRPDGGANLDFDFAFDPADTPADYQDAAITNLFYWNNILHDVHYQYGFDEAAGNFQFNNYGNGGLGNDPVQADAQWGANVGIQNNATFGTPPDGFQPQMRMFEFSFTDPFRDSDMSAEIIAHEFGHGVSNRLTGGPANSGALNAIQSGGMGEGWGDFYSLMFTQKPSDGQLDAYPVGNYVLGLPQNGPGIRRFPYSFDMSINPLTYGDFNGGFPNNEVHNSGEIWASVLWDMNWLLINGDGGRLPALGFDPDLYNGSGGNNIALQLVMDGMKLQPANPSFLDARDAILLADEMNYGGAHAEAIWTAFARRGMGLSADDGGSGSATTVTEAFDIPPFGAGVVDFDREAYEADDLVRITLRDLDLENTGVAFVEVSSTGGDLETVVLIEDDDVRGLFQGTIVTTNSDTPILEDGQLQVVVGDEITVSYFDEDPGQDIEPRTVTDMADIIEFLEIVNFDFSDSDGNAYDEEFTITGSRNQWHLSTGRGLQPGHSADDSFYFGAGETANGGGRYAPSAVGAITSPVISLDGYSKEIELQFNQVLRFAGGSDIAEVAILDRDDDELTVIASTRGIGNLGNTFSWQTARFDISSFAGKDIQVVFTFSADTDLSVSEGWYVDDLMIRGATAEPAMTVTIDRSEFAENAGFFAAQGTVTRHGDLSEPLVVWLTSSDPTEATVPFSVTIPADEASEQFNIRAIDDAVLDGTQTVEIIATAAGVPGGRATVDVTDFENLNVSIDPSSISENGGTAVGTVSRSNIDGPFEQSSAVVQATNLPLPLRDRQTTTSQLDVNGLNGRIRDVNVNLDITHTWDGDLDVFLISPSGTRVELFSDVGGNGDNFRGTTLDDQADVSILNGSAPFTGRFRPAMPLSTFHGENPNGAWTLEVTDDQAGDLGQLDSWSLELSTEHLEPLTVTLTNGDSSEISIPQTVVIPADQNSVSFDILGLDDNDLDGAQVVTIQASAAPYADGVGTIIVEDHEMLTVEISADSIPENGGTAAAVGTVTRRNSDWNDPLTVALFSSDTSAATVPAVVTIPAFTASASFNINAIDDDFLDGDQTVTITAEATGYTAGIGTLVVTDHEPLSVTVAAGSIAENAGAAATTATVTRNTADLSAPLAVSLVNGDPTEINLPSTVTIPANQSSATFSIDAVDDSVVDGTQAVVIRASAEGFAEGVETIDVTDETAPVLTIAIDADVISEQSGPLAARATVTHNLAIGLSDVVVTLMNSDPSEVAIPASVTVPASQNLVTFDVGAVNDNVLDGTQTVTITASAAGFPDASVTIDVTDHEELAIQLAETSISENAGPGATIATVRRNNSDLTEPVVVTLVNGDVTEISIPSTVTIPANETSVSFDINAVDDTLLDGTQQVSITALAAGYARGTALLDVVDHETITLTLGSDTLDEKGGTTTAIVSRSNTDNSSPLVLPLTNGDPSELNLPATVTIPANASSAVFVIRAVDDARLDGPQQVSITASASGYIGADATVTVVDNARPTLVAPRGILTNEPVTFQWSEIHGAESYELWINNRTTGQFAVIREMALEENFHTVTGLTPGDTYQWGIRARTADGFISPWSDTALFAIVETPVPRRTLGTESGTTPTISWSAVPGAARYDLWVNDLTTGQSGVIRDDTITENSFTPTSGIVTGHSYLWTVRAITQDGARGNWAPHRGFTMIGTTMGTAPVGVTPSSQPVFEWDAVPGAARYDLWVNNLSTGQIGVIRDQHIPTNSYTATFGIEAGDSYVWTVRAITASGATGPWAGHRYFTSVGTPTIVAPDGATISNRPTFTWTHAPGAERYDVWVNDLTTRQSGVIRDATISADQPLTLQTPLVAGRLQSIRVTIDGAPSQILDLSEATTIGAVKVLLEAAFPGPAGLVVDIDPANGRALRLTPTGIATTVSVQEAFGGETAALLGLLSGPTNQLVGVDVAPGLTLFTYTAPNELTEGHSYLWTVRAIAPQNVGGIWEAHHSFTITSPFAMAPPVLTAPIGFTPTNRPTFLWSDESGASEYELLVADITNGQSTIVLNVHVSQAPYQSNMSLTSGRTYRWWVRAVSSSGEVGRWSSSQTFQVAADDSIANPRELFGNGDEAATEPQPDAEAATTDEPLLVASNRDAAQRHNAEETESPADSSELDAVMAEWAEMEWWLPTDDEVAENVAPTNMVAERQSGAASAAVMLGAPLLLRAWRRRRKATAIDRQDNDK